MTVTDMGQGQLGSSEGVHISEKISPLKGEVVTQQTQSGESQTVRCQTRGTVTAAGKPVRSWPRGTSRAQTRSRLESACLLVSQLVSQHKAAGASMAQFPPQDRNLICHPSNNLSPSQITGQIGKETEHSHRRIPWRAITKSHTHQGSLQ